MNSSQYQKIYIFSLSLLMITISILPPIISDRSNNYLHVASITFNKSITNMEKVNNGSLSGYVTDTLFNPIEGARIRVSFHETYEENYTNSSGFYKVTNIPICYCYKNATASKEGYSSEWVLLAISENTTHDFILTPLYDIYVDDDANSEWYDSNHVQTIQEGIINASTGHTIFVYNGNYREYINVNKSINLIGENTNNTVINGKITFDNDGVNLSRFTILNNYSATKGGYDIGIVIASSNNTILHNNIVNISGWGISLTSSNNSIMDNTIEHCSFGAIDSQWYAREEGNNHIIGNMIKNNNIGINLISINNTITNNIFMNNGILIWHPWAFPVYHNVIQNNTVNGKPLIYLEKTANKTLANETGQIILIDCSEIKITNQNISNSSNGITIWNSSHCSISSSNIRNITNQMIGALALFNSSNITIKDNTIPNNDLGIVTITCENISVLNNTFSTNIFGILSSASTNAIIMDNIFQKDGIVLGSDFYGTGYKSIHFWNSHIIENNSINGNPIYYYKNVNNITIQNQYSQLILANCSNISIKESNFYDINFPLQLGYSNNNKIIRNTFSNSIQGIIFDNSNHNNIYHNNFFNNIENAYDNCQNIWYANSIHQGNHFDNYQGLDANNDGIGDIPYNISGGENQDLYPLMNPIIEPPLYIWIDDDFNESTPGWNDTHFNIIQDGIDSIAENGTVHVSNGTYYESVMINKSITLCGNNKDMTTINGYSLGYSTINVYVNNVNIKEFTIIQTYGDIGLRAHNLSVINNLTVSNCIFYQNGEAGIELSLCNNSLIENCILHHMGSGIQLDSTHHTKIMGCTINNNEFGILISNSNNNLLYDNHIINNEYGTRIDSSDDNNITTNLFSSDFNGIYLDTSADNLIYNNYFRNVNNYEEYNGNNIWNISKTPGVSIIGGPYLGGNFWIDYQGYDDDNDGIGDIFIPYGPGDYLPLTYIKSDLNQSVFDRGFPIRHALDGDWGAAQSFIPNLDTLTSAQIYLRKFGSPEFNLTIELREDHPKGILLEKMMFTPEEVPSEWEWLHIDFNDSAITPNTEYFIVCPPAPDGVTTSFGYEWGYAFGNQYDPGSFWFTRDGGGLWRDLPTMYEFTFKTCGYESINNFTLKSKYSYIQSYREGGGIFPIFLVPHHDFHGNISLSINADANLTTQLNTEILNNISRNAELTIRPNNEIEIGNHTIELTATQGSISNTIYLTVEIIDVNIGEPSSYITSKRDEFINWLENEHPEYENLSDQDWFSYKTYPLILVVEHWTFLNTEWEFRICCHITIPPYNWSKMCLRKLGNIDPVIAAHCEYNGITSEIPISEYPIFYAY